MNIRKKRQQLNERKIDLMGIKIPLMGGIFLLILFIGNVFFAIDSGTLGSELVGIESRSQELVNNNKNLKENIIAKSSLTKIQESEIVAGMTKPQQIIYITNITGVAKLP